jgi:hypothetical protein
MNAAYYNAGPGERMIDEMFYECEDVRDEIGDIDAECGDDIDDAYDRERDRDDYEGEEDYD